jgi:hypothetical protein
MHAAPADLAFGRQALAIVFGNVARLAKGLRDQRVLPAGIGLAHSPALAPNRCARRRTAARPASRSLPRDPASLAHLSDEIAAPPRRPWPSRRRSAARPAPPPSRPPAPPRTLSASRPRSSSVGIDADVRIEQKKSTPVELRPIHLRRRRSGEHGVQIDGWFRIRPLAYQAGPHGDSGKVVVRTGHAHELCTSIFSAARYSGL